MNKMKNKEDEFKKYLEETKNIEANADEQVLKFIFDFVNLQGTPESAEAIYKQFGVRILLLLCCYAANSI